MAWKKGNNYIVDEEKGIAKIELNRKKGENLWATIDLEDLQRVLDFPYTWFAKYYEDIDNYYAAASMYVPELKRAKIIYLHQFIMNAEGKIVDHKTHDTLNDTKENLRVVPDNCNSKNRKSRNKNNKSGYRNVCWLKNENVWVVQISINGKNTRLKKFPPDQLEEAGAYAEEMRKKYYGEFAGAS